MKIALDYKKLHLRFVFGVGFVWFILTKIINGKDKAAAQKIKPIGRQIKKLLKDYKRNCGSLSLVEIESKNGTRIAVRI